METIQDAIREGIKESQRESIAYEQEQANTDISDLLSIDKRKAIHKDIIRRLN